MMERKSWPCRKKGKHGGTLGRAAMEVLRTMLFVIKKIDGKLFPSIEALAILCRMSKQTIVTALKVLEQMGFVTVHKRIKRIQTPLGARVVQDSNAYEFHFPKIGLGALAMAVFCGRSSESKNSDASSTSYKPSRDRVRGEAEKGLAGKEADRWWLLEPLQTGNGGWR
jgi:DNA-binding transcriptional MocR family regulator